MSAESIAIQAGSSRAAVLLIDSMRESAAFVSDGDERRHNGLAVVISCIEDGSQ
jgi:hypothetical protein